GGGKGGGGGGGALGRGGGTSARPGGRGRRTGWALPPPPPGRDTEGRRSLSHHHDHRSPRREAPAVPALPEALRNLDPRVREYAAYTPLQADPEAAARAVPRMPPPPPPGPDGRPRRSSAPPPARAARRLPPGGQGGGKPAGHSGWFPLRRGGERSVRKMRGPGRTPLCMSGWPGRSGNHGAANPAKR